MPQLNPPTESVLITGSTSGIGLETTLLYLKKNYYVHAVGRQFDQLKLKLSQLDPSWLNRISFHSCDLSIESEIQSVVQSVTQYSLPCLTLINCAGIFQRHNQGDKDISHIWKNQFEINLLAPVILTQLFIPYWKTYQKASVLNVASTLGMRASKQVSSYSSIKAALIRWTESLALDEGSWGLRANCIAPGIVDTPIHAFHSISSEEKNKVLQSLNPLQPLGRIGKPSEIAESIFFLASHPQSQWTTGATLAIDGGINLL